MNKRFLDSYKSVEWQKNKNKILAGDNYVCKLCHSKGEDEKHPFMSLVSLCFPFLFENKPVLNQ